MKEILFRGKSKKTGEWMYGYYMKIFGTSYIIDVDSSIDYDGLSDYEEVIPETVGRLIEHPDYDSFYENKKIFEGDIIEVYHPRNCDIKQTDPKCLAIVVNESCITEDGKGRWFPQDTTRIKVVGNVHDNPELVGKKYADLYLHYNRFGKED